MEWRPLSSDWLKKTLKSVILLYSFRGSLLPVNDAPTANNQTISTVKNSGIDIILIADDPDWDYLTWHINQSPSHGVLTGTAPSLRYTPNNGYIGTDQFTFHVNDGVIDSNIATVTVNVGRKVWYVNVNAIGLNDGSSWYNAFTHPQNAINTASSGDQVWVAKGTYTSNTPPNYVITMKTGIEIYGGFNGTENSLTERNYTTNETILNGESSVYHVVIGTDFSRIDGFTITGGNSSSTSLDNDGGGMYNINCSPVIVNCIFRNNNASNYMTSSFGGGIYNDGGSSSTIENCSFIENSSWGGGAISNFNSSPIIRNCRFTNNSIAKSTGMGGAIYNYNSTSEISNCVFDGNFYNESASGSGGGIYNDSSSPNIKNCLFINNHVGRYGGGMYNNGGSPVIINCTFTNNSVFNSTMSRGGGLYNNSTPTIIDCIIWGNVQFYTNGDLYNSGSTPIITYTDIAGGYTGTGNINVNPLFVTGTKGTYYLSQINCLQFLNLMPILSSQRLL